MKRKVEYNMEKRTKIAIIMVLFALVCFGISGYYIAQAIEAPNLANSQETEEIPEETNDITNTETATAVTTGISLADVSAEDTKTTTAKTLEVQFATVNVSGVTEPQEEESKPEKEVQEVTDTAEIETTEPQEETNSDEKIYAFNGVELSQSDFLLLKKPHMPKLVYVMKQLKELLQEPFLQEQLKMVKPFQKLFLLQDSSPVQLVVKSIL